MQLCAVSHYWQCKEEENSLGNNKCHHFSLEVLVNENPNLLSNNNNNNNNNNGDNTDNNNKKTLQHAEASTKNKHLTVIRKFISEMTSKATSPHVQCLALSNNCYSNNTGELCLQKLKRCFFDELNVQVFQPLMAIHENNVMIENNNNNDNDNDNYTFSIESNEHYWRRLAKHFIAQSYDKYAHTSNNNNNNSSNVVHEYKSEILQKQSKLYCDNEKSEVSSPFTPYTSEEEQEKAIPCGNNETRQENDVDNSSSYDNNDNNSNLKRFEPEDSFYMIDLGVLVRQMARWRRALPMVRPFYAVKCNPSLPILQTLAACGAGFDCASKQEIELILSHHLVCDPEKDIIFANPCKQIGDLRAITINKYHVRFVTVDSVAEMIKLHRYFPQAKILIRIATNDVHAVCAFSTKFGASLDDIEKILEVAVKYKLEIYGVSFHVGSGNGDINAYAAALYDAAKVFRQAASFGFNCSLLDIGGGYPGDISFQDDHHFSCTNSKLTTAPHNNNNNNNSDNNDSNNTFESIASVIRPILETEFCDTIIIAEPGRFFTAASHTLVMNVFGERHIRLSASSANEIKARLVQEQERQQETEHLHEANNSNIGDGNCEAVQHVPANWSNVD